MAYPLPAFVSRTLADQPSPPRQVPLKFVVRAVLGGLDCAIYLGAALFLIAVGLAVIAHALPSANPSTDVPGGLVLAGLGVPSGLLAVFRIWQVTSVLRSGDAQMGEIVEAEVGPARIYGTPWGEPMGTRMQPIAARGTYRVISTGATGRYYMQQLWALSLQPGTAIWVLRRRGRDVLFAPR
jgi:hypothetical protein